MMNETAKRIAREFQSLAAANPVLQAMLKKLSGGKADYLDADRYALELASVLGKVLQQHLGEGKLDGDAYREVIESVLPSELFGIYEDVADYAKAIQQGINERAGIGLNAVRPEFNQQEAAAITDKAVSVNAFDDIPGGLTQDMQHMAQNVATDTMKANAKLANDVGMEATVTRIYDGVGVHTQNGGEYRKECKWCKDRCGTDVPYSQAIARDMFRRHPGCGCEIQYTVNGRTQVQDDWRKNQWVVKNTQALKKEPYKCRGRDVTKEYRQDATPRRGIVTKEPGFRDVNGELATAKIIFEQLGGDLVLREERSGQKNPDYEWLGQLWDLKSTTTEKAANSALREGFKQIAKNPGGVILNYGNNEFVLDDLLREIDKRVSWYRDAVSADVMIISKGKIIKVLRY